MCPQRDLLINAGEGGGKNADGVLLCGIDVPRNSCVCGEEGITITCG